MMKVALSQEYSLTLVVSESSLRALLWSAPRQPATLAAALPSERTTSRQRIPPATVMLALPDAA